MFKINRFLIKFSIRQDDIKQKTLNITIHFSIYYIQFNLNKILFIIT